MVLHYSFPSCLNFVIVSFSVIPLCHGSFESVLLMDVPFLKKQFVPPSPGGPGSSAHQEGRSFARVVLPFFSPCFSQPCFREIWILPW